MEDALKDQLEAVERGSHNMDATSNIEAEASAAAAPRGAGGPKHLQAADFGFEEHEEEAILEQELAAEKAHLRAEKERRRAEAEAWARHTAADLSAGNPKLAGRISADLLLVRDCMPMDAASFWTDDSHPSKQTPIGVAAPVADTDSAADEIALEKERRRARKEARRAEKEEAAAANAALADEDAAIAEASDPAAAADEKQMERERRRARREARRAEREAAEKDRPEEERSRQPPAGEKEGGMPLPTADGNALAAMAENEERRLRRKEQRRAEREERRHAEKKGGAAEDAPLETPQDNIEAPALAAAAMTASAEARIQADLALVKRQQGNIAVW